MAFLLIYLLDRELQVAVSLSRLCAHFSLGGRVWHRKGGALDTTATPATHI